MKATTLPAARPTAARPAEPRPARPVLPRPVWERHKLFQEPAYDQAIVAVDDEDEDGEW